MPSPTITSNSDQMTLAVLFRGGGHGQVEEDTKPLGDAGEEVTEDL